MPAAVVIAPEPFGVGVDLIVTPPLADQCLDREFPTIAEARAAALELCHERGCLLVDRTGEGSL